jgi:dipeptidyl aminopeptidase/acylaminoacyl peptidase
MSAPVSTRGRGVLLWTLGVWLGCTAAVRAADLPGPRVKEVVEFTRVIQPRNHDTDELRKQVSPDGSHAFIVTRKADVRTDENRYEILLLDVRPQRLATGRQRAPKALFALRARQDDYYGEPSLQDVGWAGPGAIVFRARYDDRSFQVYRLDVATRRVTQLTRETREIVSFAVSSDLRRVVYAVQLPNPPMAAGERSIVVGNQSFWSVKFGQHDLRSQLRRYQYFATGRPGQRPRALGASFPEANIAVPSISVSPDGRWAVLSRYRPERQLEWARQFPMVADTMARIGPAQSIDPLHYFSRPSSYVARQWVAYRLSDGREQAVVDAPDDALPGGGQIRSDRLWQSDGRSVVIAGIHLPPSSGSSKHHGSYIIEYWPQSARWEVIAALEHRLSAAYRAEGAADAFVAIDGERRRRFEWRADGGWTEREDVVPGDDGAPSGSRDSWRLHMEEGLDRPPDVVARGPGGRIVRLTALNPQFDPKTWGSVSPFSWSDPAGRRWDGGLMVPAGLDRKARHALVIQTYGFAKDRFYLDGPNVSDGFTSGFAGRAFLRQGMLVLAMPWAASTDSPADAPGAVAAFMDGVRGAIAALEADGLVDPARVGIMGWSATGERVLNLVTFSDVPIRAATLLDGDANTLFSVAVTYGASDSMWTHKERVNRGLPFRGAQDAWVRNDPSLNTDCVKAATRIETYGPWVLNNWDVYALLRRQYKPAEMIVIPGGAHALSRPSERMISLQGNVDWFGFWLNGRERDEKILPREDRPRLQAQYARWRQMAALKDADDARPACARLRHRN